MFKNGPHLYTRERRWPFNLISLVIVLKPEKLWKQSTFIVSKIWAFYKKPCKNCIEIFLVCFSFWNNRRESTLKYQNTVDDRDEHQEYFFPKVILLFRVSINTGFTRVPYLSLYVLYTSDLIYPHNRIITRRDDISCVKSPRVQSKQVEIERHVDTRGLHFRLGAERDRDLSKW